MKINLGWVAGFLSLGRKSHWKFKPALDRFQAPVQPVECLGCVAAKEISKRFGKHTLHKPGSGEVTTHEWRVKAVRDTGEVIYFSIFDFHGSRWQVAAEDNANFSSCFQEILQEVGLAEKVVR